MAVVVNRLADKAAGVATDSVERRALGRGKSAESKARAEHGVGEPARSESERMRNGTAVTYPRQEH